MMGCSTAAWKALSHNPGTECGNEMLPQREEKPRKQVWFEAEEELGAKPDLPTELVHFLAEGVPPPAKSPQYILALAGGA